MNTEVVPSSHTRSYRTHLQLKRENNGSGRERVVISSFRSKYSGNFNSSSPSGWMFISNIKSTDEDGDKAIPYLTCRAAEMEWHIALDYTDSTSNEWRALPQLTKSPQGLLNYITTNVYYLFYNCAFWIYYFLRYVNYVLPRQRKYYVTSSYSSSPS